MLSSNVDDYQSMLCASQAERRPVCTATEALHHELEVDCHFYWLEGQRKTAEISNGVRGVRAERRICTLGY